MKIQKVLNSHKTIDIIYSMRNRSVYEQFNLHNPLLFRCIRFALCLVLSLIDIQVIFSPKNHNQSKIKFYSWYSISWCWSWITLENRRNEIKDHFHVIWKLIDCRISSVLVIAEYKHVMGNWECTWITEK